MPVLCQNFLYKHIICKFMEMCLHNTCTYFCCTGARADLRNNDNKLPWELAKDPETAALVRQAGGYIIYIHKIL